MDLRSITEEGRKRFSRPMPQKPESRGRGVSEEPCDLRTDFQRDRDRSHSKGSAPEAQNPGLSLREGDHYRTRLTHTLEVSPDRPDHRAGPAPE